MRTACFLALVFFVEGCAAQAVHREPPAACESPRVLYVVKHGGHTGIVVGSSDLVALLPPLAADIGSEGYAEIG